MGLSDTNVVLLSSRFPGFILAHNLPCLFSQCFLRLISIEANRIPGRSISQISEKDISVESVDNKEKRTDHHIKI